jgi:hypothetical protein
MPKIKLYILTYLVVIAAHVVWSIISKPISDWIYFVLTSIGVPTPLVQIILVTLPLILLLEIVAKILFLELAVPPQKFVFTQAELWPHVNQNELNRYTLELEQLGFIQLTDYTLSSSNKALARLFSHPDKFCFVEVFQIGNLPIVCSISCLLEKNWSLAVVNSSVLSAISYAFFRQPHKLVRKIENVPVNMLLQSLLEWREQICSDLNLELIKDVKSETYFEKQHSNRIDRKRTLLRKSVIWSLLEMLWFSLNPKSDWLGDYEKPK